jgi:hypothetical protein
MKIVLSIIGVVLVIVGAIWFLQGINILPGSFMTGQTKWAIYGAISFIVGVGVLLFTYLRRSSSTDI